MTLYAAKIGAALREAKSWSRSHVSLQEKLCVFDSMLVPNSLIYPL
jgi:hypothetical protein